MKKQRIKEVIVVEGRYDRNMLLQVVDATVVETGGFSVFNDREKLNFLRRLAEKRGLILLTDSDGAGFVIRNYLKGALPKEHIKQAYIPDMPGKERRKRKPGKEGKLGVEGMSPQAPPLRTNRPLWKKTPLPKLTCWKRASSARAVLKRGTSCFTGWSCRSICPPTPCWRL